MFNYKKSNISKFCSRRTRDKIFSSFFCCLIIFSLVLIYIPGGLTNPVFAETTDSDGKRAEEIRTELNAQIEELTKQIEQVQETIAQIQAQGQSLSREISMLNNQIKQFELEIKQTNLIINGLAGDIDDAQIQIGDLERQTNDEKIILGELLREIYKYDDVSLLEIILIKEKLSDFFSEIQSLHDIQIRIQNSLEEISVLKNDLEDKKTKLEDQKNEMVALKAIQEAQKYSIEKKKQERQKLLNETKGQESLYQKSVKSKQANVNTIRSQLYILQGMGGSLSFENALNLAEFASSVTGARPALLLAILSRESGWGANVGKGTWRSDMKPDQHSAYLAICDKLGFNPDLMPVSRRAWYGWGGAMGPAQFLPKTWLGYESRIAAVTGHNPPSPWDIEDAFVAAALYLINAGAASQTYNAEWKAAMIYLAGSNWQKPSLHFYGDQVMNLANTFQEQINLIKQH